MRYDFLAQIDLQAHVFRKACNSSVLRVNVKSCVCKVRTRFCDVLGLMTQSPTWLDLMRQRRSDPPSRILSSKRQAARMFCSRRFQMTQQDIKQTRSDPNGFAGSTCEAFLNFMQTPNTVNSGAAIGSLESLPNTQRRRYKKTSLSTRHCRE